MKFMQKIPFGLRCSQLFTAIFLLCLTTLSQADDMTQTSFGDYKILHTVFNSSFIKPEVASTYNLTRGKDRVLVNIALVKNDGSATSNGLPASVSGYAANLMQQRKPLTFIEINEQDAVYYLAALRIDNEEVLHFNIDVSANGQTYSVTFSKKLYVD